MARIAITAASRRFVVLPILALALAGSGQTASLFGSKTQTPGGPRPTPKPSADVARAKAALLRALDAERIFRVDNLAFASGKGPELTELVGDEAPGARRVGWGTEVIVEVPANEAEANLIVVLRAPLANGESLCLSEVTSEVDAGVWYARAPARATCPKPARGMPGWSADEATGWGT